MSLHLSKCQIVGNLMQRLNYFESFEQALYVLVHVYLSHRRPANARMKVDEGS